MITSDVLSRFIVEALRLSGALASYADEMVADIGLSSARMQVVGAIHDAPVAQPVAHLARGMRLSRQGVQRIVNELHDDGFVAFETNPHHQRAHLVVLTESGAKAFSIAIERQNIWMATIKDTLTNARLADATQTMIDIRDELEIPHATAESMSHGHQEHV
jgi:DNA-binding MarR family transcriptional regulator